MYIIKVNFNCRITEHIKYPNYGISGTGVNEQA